MNSDGRRRPPPPDTGNGGEPPASDSRKRHVHHEHIGQLCLPGPPAIPNRSSAQNAFSESIEAACLAFFHTLVFVRSLGTCSPVEMTLLTAADAYRRVNASASGPPTEEASQSLVLSVSSDPYMAYRIARVCKVAVREAIKTWEQVQESSRSLSSLNVTAAAPPPTSVLQLEVDVGRARRSNLRFLTEQRRLRTAARMEKLRALRASKTSIGIIASTSGTTSGPPVSGGAAPTVRSGPPPSATAPSSSASSWWGRWWGGGGGSSTQRAVAAPPSETIRASATAPSAPITEHSRSSKPIPIVSSSASSSRRRSARYEDGGGGNETEPDYEWNATDDDWDDNEFCTLSVSTSSEEDERTEWVRAVCSQQEAATHHLASRMGVSIASSTPPSSAHFLSGLLLRSDEKELIQQSMQEEMMLRAEEDDALCERVWEKWSVEIRVEWNKNGTTTTPSLGSNEPADDPNRTLWRYANTTAQMCRTMAQRVTELATSAESRCRMPVGGPTSVAPSLETSGNRGAKNADGDLGVLYPFPMRMRIRKRDPLPPPTSSSLSPSPSSSPSLSSLLARSARASGSGGGGTNEMTTDRRWTNVTEASSVSPPSAMAVGAQLLQEWMRSTRGENI